MARGDGTVDGDGVGGHPGAHTDASDLRLTEMLRADTPAAYAALRELRARHGPSVLDYARRCTTSDSGARQLAAQAFTHAARETARGTDPGGPLRHRLLLLTVRVAAAWTADGRAGGLDPGLHLVLSSSGPDGPAPSLLAAFRTLPYRAQGLLWYGIVEQEPADRTATLLGLTRQDVVHDTRPALQALGRACLRARLAASDDPRCADFRRLIEESVRPDGPRDSADLHTHMAHCGHCTAAYEELCALRDAPRTTLAEGLLPWAGTAYTAPAPAGPSAGTGGAPGGTWPLSRRLVLASAALGVAVVPLLFLLWSPDGTPAGRTPDPGPTVAVPPPVTVTATPSPPPTASATRSAAPSPSKPSGTGRPGPSAPPHPTPSSAPAYPPPGGAYAQVVNLASGLCLDIDGDLENRTDVVTAACDSSRSQRWRVDAERGVLRSYADSDYCLDSRGAVDRGVGIWECDSLDGRNGQNLRFAVDARGVIRPAVAPDHAVTAAGSGAVSLGREAGRTDQRWRGGT
ncbi:RICIN domain-containing protein [Streptomyces prasinopilosus]|uniref:Ricin-type beta-trefoil lectin domain-containing protein n=1 Tax=Streptomyces prasinopilosus TaxID=67344 RepID=A0A1G6RBL2_9ACTN|nr:RICIN domain-containing protein [Streptomyces prasinopilosus]SDD01437.1 Ricin-type beta-trefoil lectin domain-containing protein [Streptomyces prasinopilosus]